MEGRCARGPVWGANDEKEEAGAGDEGADQEDDEEEEIAADGEGADQEDDEEEEAAAAGEGADQENDEEEEAAGDAAIDSGDAENIRRGDADDHLQNVLIFERQVHPAH